MKCDELTPIELECNMGKDSVTGLVNREPWKAYDIDEVNAAIAELKDVIHELRVDLEGAKATAYADSVDAGMRERRLRRALWLAQGNGEWGISKFGVIEKAEIGWFYDTGYEKQTLQSVLRVRKWSDTEWHEPDVEYLGINE